MTKIPRVILAIYDGWGMDESGPQNAISQAKIPCFDRLWADYPHALLEASGEAVGLPEGMMGNSEVGHLTIGTGKPPETAMVQINKIIEDHKLGEVKALQDLVAHVKANKSKMHLIGLVSPGGVHSHQKHLYALAKFFESQTIEKIAIHAIMDGRDTAPTSGAGFLEELEAEISSMSGVSIATMIGRFYAMDRDKRAERTETAVKLLFNGEGENRGSEKPSQVLKELYTKGVQDEHLTPYVFTDEGGNVEKVENGDGILFFNFRPDRAIQLSKRIIEESSDRNIHFVTMTAYDESIKAPVAIPPIARPVNLASVISGAGLKQIHIAETEKYAHVTYFLNGGIEKEVLGEDRILVPSNRDVATYDLAPEMKAAEIAAEVVKAIKAGKHDFIILNIANPDMVGHTGNLKATIEAIEYTDRALTNIAEAADDAGDILVITADHGNAEKMIDPVTGEKFTAHTCAKVPLIITDRNLILEEHGELADVAPTILDLLGIKKPAEMTGNSLIKR